MLEGTCCVTCRRHNNNFPPLSNENIFIKWVQTSQRSQNGRSLDKCKPHPSIVWPLTEIFTDLFAGWTVSDGRIACFTAQSTPPVCSCSQGTHIIITFVTMAMVIMIPCAIMKGKYIFHFLWGLVLGQLCLPTISVHSTTCNLLNKMSHFRDQSLSWLFPFTVATSDKHSRSYKQGFYG